MKNSAGIVFTESNQLSFLYLEVYNNKSKECMSMCIYGKVETSEMTISACMRSLFNAK